MKKLIAIMMLFVLIPALVFAAKAGITLKWDYSGVAESFNLYMDDKIICSQISGDLRESTCDVLLPPGERIFELTAVEPDGTESPRSPKYIVNVPQDIPVIKELKINILLDSGITITIDGNSATGGTAP